MCAPSGLGSISANVSGGRFASTPRTNVLKTVMPKKSFPVTLFFSIVVLSVPSTSIPNPGEHMIRVPQARQNLRGYYCTHDYYQHTRLLMFLCPCQVKD